MAARAANELELRLLAELVVSDVTPLCSERIRKLCDEYGLEPTGVLVETSYNSYIHIYIDHIAVATGNTYGAAFAKASAYLKEETERRHTENPDGDALQRLINK